MWFYTSDWLFIARFLNSHRSGVLKRWHGWCCVKLQPSWRKFYVHRTTMLHVTSCKATYVRCMCGLAVTCHLHFWQNDRDLLRATAVTRRWKGYRNKSQHRKLTLEKKILLPLLLGFEPRTFQSRVRRSNQWAIPTPGHFTQAQVHTPSIAFWHLPPNSARFSYATEGALFISTLQKHPLTVEAT